MIMPHGNSYSLVETNSLFDIVEEIQFLSLFDRTDIADKHAHNWPVTKGASKG